MTAVTDVLAQLAERPNRRLSSAQLRGVAEDMFHGRATPAQIGAFLMAMRLTGETGQEVEAFVRVMVGHSVPFPRPAGDAPIVDTCGTGGDGRHTFNISTTTALLVAACGVRVAKHGNRSASSKCGSADVLEALGYDINMTPEAASGQLAEHGFAFLFARTYHPAMKFAAEARRDLAVRTLFNLCGPLSNPARPTHQLVGVSSRDLIEPIAHALRNLGVVSLVVHGSDGLDEITTCQVTEGLFVDSKGAFHPWSISPSDLGLRAVEMAELVGGDPAENAAIVREVLEGREGAHADVVNLNAAAVLWLAGVEPDIQRAFGRARAAQRSGAGARLLEQLTTKN